ncbi:MAG: DUF4276 family protein [Austwickia sp.]|nr:DUF4276 family protein [Actinomycetota bacterium]MCB1254897.1 DUF4276 family protein [Austwickia sp.]
MSPDGTSSAPGLRLVRLHVENYRVLKDVTFEALTPYTVLFGPNGSGKSTALDVLEFVAEAFATNLTAAWDRRGGAAGLMTRGSKGPLVIEIDAEASGTGHLLTYRLELTQDDRGPVVERETVRLRTSSHDDASRTLLELRRGAGTAVSAGAVGTATDDVSVSLSAVNAIGLATAALIVVSRSGAAPAPAESPHLLTLSRFILGWRFTEAARVRPRTPAVTVSHPSLPSKTLDVLVEERSMETALRIILEAWFFGDIAAVRQVYPRVPDSLGSRAAYRDPDAIAGGTWESLEVVLQQAGYMRGGLRKVALAESVAPHMDLANNTSRSFQVTIAGIRRLVGRAA